MLPCRHVWIVLTSVALVAPALAAAPPSDATPSEATLAQQAAARFPQPVRVGDLIGQYVLKPVEAQPVLGTVSQVVQGGDGVDVVVRLGGVLGVGSRLVAVPVAAVVLVGPSVAIKGLTPEQLRALPAYAGDAPPLAADARIEVGLSRPFH